MIRVFSVAIPSRILTLFISESFLITACYLFAAWLDPDLIDFDSFLRVDSGALRILFVVATILLGLYFRDLYTQVRIRNRIALLQELSMIFGVAFVAQGVINYLNHDLTLPRKAMILGSVLALVLLFCWRLLFAAAAGDDGRGIARLIFLGMSPTIRKVAQHLSLHPELGLAPVGYLDDGIDGSAPASLPHLGTHADLDEAIAATHPSSIVIGKREAIKPWWTDEFLDLYFGGVHTEEAATLYENAFGRVCACEVWPQDLVFSDKFEPRSLDSKTQTFYSTAIALLALIALSPVILLIILWLKLSSREPVLSRQQRVGLHGVPFTMYSFRTDLRPKSLSSGISGKPKPFLERTGLDTLPRLLNVLTGQMALVGPQPERPEFAARLSQEIPFYNQRHRVKPGLTGWEQIHRKELDPFDSVCQFEYDLYYMKHLGASLDSMVLLLWLRKVLVGDLAAI
jgi:lipopolysaccharide/colanic/teichoic acid biosynthesis glycosyltransferase